MGGDWRTRGDRGKRITGRRGVELRKRRLLRTDGLCERCLAMDPPRISAATEVDHIIPLNKGGLDEDSNTQNLCREHHDIKTRTDFGQKAPKRRISIDGWPAEG